ncbi:hypothetical protein M8Z33_26590 [Streptomyces sp. ZAF1911]|uniref:alpha/beta fold hydrolase n=1 Tax=Streptomyces sp. ZAF1911 TaxID=2944129 RepID=UPI00237BF51F|nr:hypothetical protein [Streptomyces sp. ZAF1911]MDD9380158.1 hypothetical protein [Streptomyces sp. ZAF1911]
MFALDLRGHGASARPRSYSLPLMRDDVPAFLDALGLDRADRVDPRGGAARVHGGRFGLPHGMIPARNG